MEYSTKEQKKKDKKIKLLLEVTQRSLLPVDKLMTKKSSENVDKDRND